MADQVVVNTLTDWNLQVLIPTFEDEGVDEEAFNCLDEECIKSLIPKVGLRAKFKKRYKVRNTKYKEQSSGSSHIRSPGLSLRPQKELILASTSREPIPDSNHTEADLTVIDQHQTDPLSLDEADEQQESVEDHYKLIVDQISSQAINSKDVTHIKLEVVENESDPLNETTSGPKGICFREQFNSWRREHFSSIYDLVALLEKSVNGMGILRAYRETGSLDEKFRKLLVHIIVDDMLCKDITLKSEDFDCISESIVKIFPTEEKETYYVPYGDNRKTAGLLKGKLVDRYRNKRKQLFALGLVPKPKKKLKPSTPKRQETFSNVEDIVMCDVTQDKPSTRSAGTIWVSKLLT